MNECNDKDVFKRLSIYLVSSWLLIQVMDVTSKPLGLPDYSVTILLIILIIGFPINMYLVWLYHIKNLNPSYDKETNKEIVYTYNKNSFKKMYFSVITFTSIIAVLLTFTILNNNFSTKSVDLEPVVSTNKIAILKFGNNTGNPDYDDIGKMASDWLIHGITENEVGQTVSPKVIEDYTNILKGTDVNTIKNSVVKKYFKPEKIISGNYFLKNDKLIFQGSIIDGNVDTILFSFESIECSVNSPLDCVESFKQRVLGYLTTEDKKQTLLQEKPPVYKAYQLVLDAKANLNDPKESLRLLNEAIAIDDNYFEPKVLRVANYYNEGRYREADSLRKLIKLTSRNNKRQQNLLNLYQALIEGNNKRIYETLDTEYNHAPFDLESNQSIMTVAVEFVNRPEEVQSIFDEIVTDKMALENCVYCEYRIYAKGKADVELGNYNDAIQLFKDIPITKSNSYLFQPILIASYVRANKLVELENFEAAQKLILSTNEMQGFYTFVAKEFLLQQQTEKAQLYFNKVKNLPNKESYRFANALYHLNEYDKAKNVLFTLHQKSPKNIHYITLYAKILYKMGAIQEANAMIQKLSNFIAPYEYGEIDYAFAKYYAAIGNDALSLSQLKKSIAKGNRYTLNTFKNDSDFLPYFDTDAFNEVLTYWH